MSRFGTVPAWLAGVVIGTYGWGFSGAAVVPAVWAAVALGGALFLARSRPPVADPAQPPASSPPWITGRTLAAGSVFVVTLAWLLRAAWPDLLPPGGASDLAHHLQLIDVLQRTRHLVTDPGAGAVLGEMAHYTPGVHWLVVVVADLAGVEPLRAVYPLLAFTIAVKAALIVFIAHRALDGRPGQLALSVAAAALVLFAPRAYVIDGFLQAGFLAQVAAEVFLVAGWWGIAEWRARPSTAWLVFIGLMGAAVFLTWPIWIGPLLLTMGLVVVTREGASWPQRAGLVALVSAPFLIVAAMHLSAHAAWLRLAGAPGAVPAFDAGVATAALIVLAIVGVRVASGSSATRVILYAAAAVTLQALALWALAAARGVAVPYMALKMIYVAIYPAAVLAAIALSAFVNRAPVRMQRALATAVAVVALVVAVVALRGSRVPPSIASLDLARAGTWAREHVPPSCVDYIVRDAEQAYWLHLAVLGQPRAEARIAEFDTYTANDAAGRWIEGRHRRYGIALRALLPGEVLQRIAVLREAGTAVVFSDRTAPASPEPPCVTR